MCAQVAEVAMSLRMELEAELRCQELQDLVPLEQLLHVLVLVTCQGDENMKVRKALPSTAAATVSS